MMTSVYNIQFSGKKIPMQNMFNSVLDQPQFLVDELGRNSCLGFESIQ